MRLTAGGDNPQSNSVPGGARERSNLTGRATLDALVHAPISSRVGHIGSGLSDRALLTDMQSFATCELFSRLWPS